jgi:diguanylate cyclase (GGDEF)-like protein
MHMAGVKERAIDTLEYWWNRIGREIEANERVMDQVAAANVRRLYSVSVIALPIVVLQLLIFILGSSETRQVAWRNGIVAANSALALGMFLFFLLSRHIRQKDSSPAWRRSLALAACVFILLVGVVIVAIDQLVTTNITPFMIACTIAGMVFLLRPLQAVSLYTAAYISYFWAMGLTQQDSLVLLSNRVNGVTAVGLGLFLSVVLWHVNRESVEKSSLIREQQLELEEKNRELEYLAIYDPLTGLINRRRFIERVNTEVAMMRRYQHESCVLLMDMDLFKHINDTHGHPVGDKVLSHVASILKNSVRETDVVSRWGGEEFFLLLPRTSLTAAEQVAEKLRSVLEKTPFLHNGICISFAASIGVAPLLTACNALDASYRLADKALYSAKQAGRNRVMVAS